MPPSSTWVVGWVVAFADDNAFRISLVPADNAAFIVNLFTHSQQSSFEISEPAGPRRP
jgi:hypothetical protein